MKNYNTFQKLKQHKIEVHGIKTDSLLVNNNPKNRKLLRQIFDLSDEIGCFKLEFDKYLTDKKIEITPNELPHIEKVKVNEYEVKDEYDTNELINLMRDKNIFVKDLSLASAKQQPVKIIWKFYSFHHIINYVSN